MLDKSTNLPYTRRAAPPPMAGTVELGGFHEMDVLSWETDTVTETEVLQLLKDRYVSYAYYPYFKDMEIHVNEKTACWELRPILNSRYTGFSDAYSKKGAKNITIREPDGTIHQVSIRRLIVVDYLKKYLDKNLAVFVTCKNKYCINPYHYIIRYRPIFDRTTLTSGEPYDPNVPIDLDTSQD